LEHFVLAHRNIFDGCFLLTNRNIDEKVAHRKKKVKIILKTVKEIRSVKMRFLFKNNRGPVFFFFFAF